MFNRAQPTEQGTLTNKHQLFNRVRSTGWHDVLLHRFRRHCLPVPPRRLGLLQGWSVHEDVHVYFFIPKFAGEIRTEAWYLSTQHIGYTHPGANGCNKTLFSCHDGKQVELWIGRQQERKRQDSEGRRRCWLDGSMVASVVLLRFAGTVTIESRFARNQPRNKPASRGIQ